MKLSHGRALVAIPGPSIIPDRVLRAMHRASPNIYEGGIVELCEGVLADLARLAHTSGDTVMYVGNGHAGWEAAIANVFAPGDRALVLSTGRFALGWAEMARRLGVEVEIMDFGFRAAADPIRLAERLTADREHSIKAVLTTQTDTASSVTNDIAALGAAIAAAGHPALFLVDAIASFACEPMDMDGWGVDLLVAGCQKGLMTPPGVALNIIGPRARDRRVACPSPYWDWTPRLEPDLIYQRFCGTSPTHHLFGLREALDMIAGEGETNLFERHHTFARAIWAAVETWGTAGALEPNVPRRDRRSRAVTTIRTAPGDGDRIRFWCEDAAGLTLGIGLPGAGEEGSQLFRIGHMGHLDPPMLLGALSTIEAALPVLGIDHAPGGAAAAAKIISGAASTETPAVASASDG